MRQGVVVLQLQFQKRSRGHWGSKHLFLPIVAALLRQCLVLALSANEETLLKMQRQRCDRLAHGIAVKARAVSLVSIGSIARP